jgi:hypothetical protein
MLGELVVSIVGRVVVGVLWGGVKLLARALYRVVTLPVRVGTAALAELAGGDGAAGPPTADGGTEGTPAADGADDAREAP